MKKFYLLLFNSIIFSYLSFAQCYTYTTIQTPTYEDVEAIILCEFNENDSSATDSTYAELISHNPEWNITKIGPVSNLYNCHAYAWYVSTGGDKVWINQYDQYNYPNATLFFDGLNPSYELATESTASKMFYVFDDHSAYVTAEEDMVISKWNNGPLYLHDYEDGLFAPVVNYYKRSCNTIVLKDIDLNTNLSIDDCNVILDNFTVGNNASIEIKAQTLQIIKDFNTSVGVVLNIHP